MESAGLIKQVQNNSYPLTKIIIHKAFESSSSSETVVLELLDAPVENVSLVFNCVRGTFRGRRFNAGDVGAGASSSEKIEFVDSIWTFFTVVGVFFGFLVGVAAQ